MSALRTLAARRTPLISSPIVQRAGLHQTIATRYAGKESALGIDGRAEEIQREKEDSLSKQKDGKGIWKDGLASDSESIVKADRDEVEASEATIKKLQEETKKIERK
ncbi:hypothetical protein K505DRAFT_238244 [Melanomma pulvis-pyrius CBS 109.77]|uniref:Mitochondrial ATPase inhibitor n=1 Tax=Melanomma pulvis-pyrius CBS 109.77 TaxID=1314802 RepID=A0A6A6XJ52_9PLEO|nr:hypothetical protein K505DRAFT_238244 [Melanomma pulvis-pyrius CBS 109.77]